MSELSLRDLEASFITATDDGWREVDAIVDADGVSMLCPKCFLANHGPVGTHLVICWRPKIGQDRPPTPGRWELVGTSLDDLSLVAGSSSVQIQGGCQAHFLVRNGHIKMT